MSGKKNAKGGDSEVVPALKEASVAADKNPVEKNSAAADRQEAEIFAGETTEEFGPANETPAAPGAELQTQEIPSDENRPAEEADIFSDELQLEESLSEEETRDLPEEEPAANSEGIREEKVQDGESRRTVLEKLYRITCRNKISEVIGGVMFVAGVGYTRDAYSASWFANKDGYSVSEE